MDWDNAWVLPNPSGINAHYLPADLAKLFGELRLWAVAEAQRRTGWSAGIFLTCGFHPVKNTAMNVWNSPWATKPLKPARETSKE